MKKPYTQHSKTHIHTRKNSTRKRQRLDRKTKKVEYASRTTNNGILHIKKKKPTIQTRTTKEKNQYANKQNTPNKKPTRMETIYTRKKKEKHNKTTHN